MHIELQSAQKKTSQSEKCARAIAIWFWLLADIQRHYNNNNNTILICGDICAEIVVHKSLAYTHTFPYHI